MLAGATQQPLGHGPCAPKWTQTRRTESEQGSAPCLPWHSKHSVSPGYHPNKGQQKIS